MFFQDNISLDSSLVEFLNLMKQKNLLKINKSFDITDIVVALEKSGFIDIDENKLDNIVKTGDI
jgi:hypothetical protein